MLNLGIVRVSPEAILFIVGGAEDVVANAEDHEHEQHVGAQLDRVDSKVACVQAVSKRQPYYVAQSQHETEAVRDDVDGRQHCRLHIQRVEDVERLRGRRDNHGVSDGAIITILPGHHGAIEDDPAEEAWPQLHPSLDVDLAKDWKVNARVELSADEPVVDDIAAGTAKCKFPFVFVVRLDAETVDVDERGEHVCNDEVTSNQRNEIIPNESPHDEVGPLDDGAREKYDTDEDGGRKHCSM